MPRQLHEVTIYCSHRYHKQLGLVADIVTTEDPETFVEEFNSGRMKRDWVKCRYGAHTRDHLMAEVGTKREDAEEAGLREYFS